MNLRSIPCARWVVIVVASSALLVSACAGEEPQADAQEGAAGTERAPEASASRPDVDPCTLLTAAEIEEVTGKTPGPAEPSDLGVPECSWDPADGTGPPLASVMAHFGPTPGETFEEYVEYQLETLGDLTSRETYQEVKGLGDYGVWMGRDQSGVLEVYEDDLSLTVSATAAGGRTASEIARELAEKAMARL